MINNRGQDAGYGTLAGLGGASPYDLMKSVKAIEDSLQTGAPVASDTAKMVAQLQADAKAGVVSKLDLQLMGALIDVEKIAGDSKIAKEAGIELGTYLAIKEHIKDLKLPASVQQIPGFGPCVLTVFKKMKAEALAERSKIMLASLEENIDFKLEQVVVQSQPPSKALQKLLQEDYDRTTSDIKKILKPLKGKLTKAEEKVFVYLDWYNDEERLEGIFGKGYETTVLGEMMGDLYADYQTDTAKVQPLNYVYDVLNPARADSLCTVEYQDKDGKVVSPPLCIPNFGRKTTTKNGDKVFPWTDEVKAITKGKDHMAVNLPRWMTTAVGVTPLLQSVKGKGGYGLQYDGGWGGDRFWQWQDSYDNYLTKGKLDVWYPMLLQYGPGLLEWASEKEKGKGVLFWRFKMPGVGVDRTLGLTIKEGIRTERVLRYLIERNKLVGLRLGGFLLNQQLTTDYDKYFAALSQPYLPPKSLHSWGQKQSPSKSTAKAGHHHLYGLLNSGKYWNIVWDMAIEDAKLDKYVKGKLVKGGTYSPKVTGLLWSAQTEATQAKWAAEKAEKEFNATCAKMEKGLLGAVTAKIALEFYALYAKNDALAAAGYATLADQEADDATALADQIEAQEAAMKLALGKWKKAQKALGKLQSAGGAGWQELAEARAAVAKAEDEIFALTYSRIGKAGEAQALASAAARDGNKANDRRNLSRDERDNSTSKWGKEFTVYDPLAQQGVTVVTDPSDGAKKDKQVAQDTNNATKEKLKGVADKVAAASKKIKDSLGGTGVGAFTSVDEVFAEDGAFDDFIQDQLPQTPPKKEGFPWLAVAGLGLAAAGKIPLVAGAGVAALDVALRGKKKTP